MVVDLRTAERRLNDEANEPEVAGTSDQRVVDIGRSVMIVESDAGARRVSRGLQTRRIPRTGDC